jgi:hypothetical protein
MSEKKAFTATSINEVKLQKLMVLVTNLKAEEAMERLPVSKAAAGLIGFTKQTSDPLVTPDAPEFKDNAFLKAASKPLCMIC